MKKANFQFIFKIIFSLLFIISPVKAQDPNQSIMDINNITSWIRNDGFHDWKIDKSWNGTFPKDSAAGLIYTEGIAWGGKVNDGLLPVVRVTGSTYKNGNFAVRRLFRVRPFYKTDDLSSDAASFYNVPVNQVTDSMKLYIYAQYEKDWNEWPGNDGAPYNDLNKDGIYEPAIDVPGVPGASQTLIIKYNDSHSLDIYGSPSTGIEIQETYWAYSNENTVDNDFGTLTKVIFKDVKLYYKGIPSVPANAHIDSMYIVQLTDTDVGDYENDFIGCDTTLNLGYVYNSTDTDKVYKNILAAPPAVGNIMLQGPAFFTGNNEDSAIVDFRWKHGYKYFQAKPMTVFIAHRTGGNWADATFDYNGTLEFYNLMRGYLTEPHYPASLKNQTPFGPEFNGFGTYMLSGDPINKTGWYDGLYDFPSDRRYWMVSGPVNLKLGDTAEVVTALAAAEGTDHLNSVTNLKTTAAQVNYLYNKFVQEMTAGGLTSSASLAPNQPKNYVLYQNYPNPFNSTTLIRYELSEAANVSLTIYDVLGRVVQNLVNERKEAGSYTVKFNSDGLSSGVYFYKIQFNNQLNKLVFDNLTKTNKLIIIK